MLMALVWPLFAWWSRDQPATVLADTTGEGAPLAQQMPEQCPHLLCPSPQRLAEQCRPSEQRPEMCPQLSCRPTQWPFGLTPNNITKARAASSSFLPATKLAG